MEFLGIDFGSFKTTIASSKENGKIICDEQGKRSIRTVLETTTPIRKFGNGVTGEHESTINLRSRNFRDQLNDKKCCEDIFMFMKYLNRIIKQNTTGNPSICISVPSYFNNDQRRYLLQLVKACGMKVERFFNDISAIGMFACLRREKMPEVFIIVDFGYSKTSFGYFSYENNTFKPRYIDSIEVGSRDFDEKLFNIILKKYNLQNTKIIRETLFRHFDKIKTVLNVAATATVPIYIEENPINVQVTQEEYMHACEEEYKKIHDFVIASINETSYNATVEVTGGNSSSFICKKIMDNSIEYQMTLDLSESCAIGTSLGLACSVLSNKYKIYDIIPKDISIKIKDSESKPVIVFRHGEVLNTVKSVTYNMKTGITLDVFEDKKVIGMLKIKKKETSEPEEIKITFEVDKYGLVNVSSVEGFEYEYQVSQLSQEAIDEISMLEDKYKYMEDNIEKIGNMRNELETMLMSLTDAFDNYGDLFTEEDTEKVREVAMNTFDIVPSNTLEEEMKVREEIIKSLDFVAKKIESVFERTNEELSTMINTINEYNNAHVKDYTPSYYKIQGLKYKIEGFMKEFKLDIFSANMYNKSTITNFQNELTELLKKANAEHEEKKRKEEEERKRKEEEERKRKEEEAKKKEEEKINNSTEEKKEELVDEKKEKSAGTPNKQAKKNTKSKNNKKEGGGKS